MGVDWDADALRASKAAYPYTSAEAFRWFEDLVKPNDIVLEVGCQIASWIWAWRGIEPTVRYEGLDWSDPALEIARERYGENGKNVVLVSPTGKEKFPPYYAPFNLDPEHLTIGPPAVFHHGDAREMSFEDEFDIVFTHTFYQHTSVETKRLVVPRVWEALKPGGLHIIQENTSYESPGTWYGQGWIKFFLRHGFSLVRTHDIGGGGTGFVFRKATK